MTNLQRIKYIISQITQFIVFYFGTKIFWANESWRIDKIKEMIFFLIIAIIYGIISICFYSFGAPLRIKITQLNSRYKGKTTNFSIKGRTKTVEHERLVEFKVEVSRKYSIWGKLVAKILRRIDFWIKVEPLSDNVVIQVIDGLSINSVQDTLTGFEFNLGEYIELLLNNTDQCSVSKTIYYKVLESSSVYNSDETIIIQAKLSNNSFFTSIVKIFSKIQVEEHIVKFMRN